MTDPAQDPPRTLTSRLLTVAQIVLVCLAGAFGQLACALPRLPGRLRAWWASVGAAWREHDPHPLADYRDPSEVLDVAETEQRHGREGE